MSDEQKNSSNLADKLFPEIEEELTDILDIPPEKRRLNTETYDFTVSTIIDYLSTDQIKVPTFQRGYVWNRVQASRLIESLIINCPIPVVFLSQNTDETLSVIDGNQRLNSISLYLRDGFDLQGLSVYPALNGIKYSELDPRFQRHISNRTIRCIVITKDTHPQIKFDVFERLNTGSVKLNAQELRNGLNSGSFMDMLERCGSDKTFRERTSNTKDKRMKTSELVLRYMALSQSWKTYQKPMVAFLNAFVEPRRSLEPLPLKRFEDDFFRTFAQVDKVLGKFSFKTYDEHNKNLKFNAALYDAQMVGFHLLNANDDEILAINGTKFLADNHTFINTDDFSKLITAATTDTNSVVNRIRKYQSFLRKFI